MTSKKKKSSRSRSSKGMPFWAEILLHIAAVGIGLVLFALPHHVIGYEAQSLGIVSERSGNMTAQNEPPDMENADVTEDDSVEVPVVSEQSETSEAAETVETAATEGPAEAAVDDIGEFGVKFADKFIAGPAQYDDHSYVSDNVNVQIKPYDENGVQFIVADIYVRDISCLRRAFAKDKFGRNIDENIKKVASRENSIVTLSDDYYGMRDSGIVLSNGALYKNGEIYYDICVLYWDGTVKCFHKDEFNTEIEIANSAYQAWNFGPYLLHENGEPLSDFPSRYDDLKKRDPRSAFGYYEPGHYCLIAVNGRQSASKCLSLSNLAKLSQQLDLKQMYNLDGGAKAWMCYGTETVSNPSGGGRDCSDFICIIDEVNK